MTANVTIHASAVLIGARAALIRGPSGSGKSRLTFALLEAARCGQLPFARLVGDDRIHVEAKHGRLLVSPSLALAGLLEIRGAGIRTFAFEPLAVADLVVDLAAADAERLPAQTAQTTLVEGVDVARLAVAPGHDPLPLILALHTSQAAEWRRTRDKAA
jgi:serine kinase of HPr protein (carbohydrate metabolism regulator)